MKRKRGEDEKNNKLYVVRKEIGDKNEPTVLKNYETG